MSLAIAIIAGIMLLCCIYKIVSSNNYYKGYRDGYKKGYRYHIDEKKPNDHNRYE